MRHDDHPDNTTSGRRMRISTQDGPIGLFRQLIRKRKEINTITASLYNNHRDAWYVDAVGKDTEWTLCTIWE